MKTGKFLHTWRLRITLALAMVIMGSFAQQALAQTCFGDSLALVNFYQATNGASWSSKNNWLTGPVQTWEGVTVEQGRVTRIYLPFNRVSGSLPYHLGFLQELKFLGLPGNSLQGNVPQVLVFLQKLEYLDLSENKLTGSIPSVLGFMPKLKTLILARNELSGSIPVTITNLTALSLLDLANNKLSGQIPENIGMLRNLGRLYLSNNQLKGSIPASMGDLRRAKQIFLLNNQLSGTLPASIGNLDSLVFFSVANNKLKGAVPNSFVNLKQIYLLNISGNQIVDLPNLSSVTSLFQFTVANNKLTFADIQPNLARMLAGSYAPQDSVGTNKTITVCAGKSVTLSADVIESSPSNTFTWFNQDFSFVSATSSSPLLTLDNVQPSDAGVYSTEIANANVPDLFLYRKSVRLVVKSCPASSTAFSLEEANTVVFPVPFEDKTTVRVNSDLSEDVVVKVFDQAGNVVAELQSKTNESIEVGEHLQPGTYYVKSQYGDKQETVRIVKK